MARTNTDQYNSSTSVSDKVKGAAQSTAAAVQENVQSTAAKTRDVLFAGLDLAQAFLGQGNKEASKRAKKAKKQVAQAQDTLQDTMQTSIAAAQEALSENVKRARKSLKRAQKNVSQLQDTLQDTMQASLSKTQDTLQSGVETAQDVLKKGAVSAGMGLVKAGSKVKDVQDTVQNRLESARRRRRRARFLFRMGLLAGLAAALLYTPWPGTETRQKLAELWQGVYQRAQEMINSFSSNM